MPGTIKVMAGCCKLLTYEKGTASDLSKEIIDEQIHLNYQCKALFTIQNNPDLVEAFAKNKKNKVIKLSENLHVVMVN